MRARLSAQPLMPIAITMLLANGTSGCLGRASEADPPPSAALRARFLERAALILEAPDVFLPTPDGFTRPTSATPALTVDLPRDAATAIRVHAAAGFDLRVREFDAQGEATLSGSAVTYRRAGGTSFWTAVPGGVEEWLHLDATAAHGDHPSATWEVEGGTLRQQENAVEVLDGRGQARVRVTAPRAYAAGGREVKARLAVDGQRIELFVDGGGEAVLVDPAWLPANAMHGGHAFHTATLIPSGPQSGKVLVTGGHDGSAVTKAVELYDPVSGTWTQATDMLSPRAVHTATWIPSISRVLVTGGAVDLVVHPTLSAELYDPVTNTWAAAKPMSAPRSYHTATLLLDGTVLVAGGSAFTSGVTNYLASAELYHPTTDMWETVGSMPLTRRDHTATLLADGRVLVAGGQNASTNNLAHLYDPVGKSWAPAASMPVARYGHAALLISTCVFRAS